MENSTPRSEFITGARDTLPLILGAIPFGIIFGALAGVNGLSPAATLGMSAIVFAGSSQFIAAGLVGNGVSLPLIVLTTFVVNLRHVLYSTTLMPRLKHLPQTWLIPLSFMLTDETFAVMSARFASVGDEASSPNVHWYQFGSSLAMYLNWSLCTLIGVLAGQAIPDAANWGLDFAMSVTFIGIVVPMLRTRPLLASALVAGATALLTYSLPNKLGLMIAALAGILAGLLIEVLSPAPAIPTEEVQA
jgi:4-azaleucine resistance transporter AzlC